MVSSGEALQHGFSDLIASVSQRNRDEEVTLQGEVLEDGVEEEGSSTLSEDESETSDPSSESSDTSAEEEENLNDDEEQDPSAESQEGEEGSELEEVENGTGDIIENAEDENGTGDTSESALVAIENLLTSSTCTLPGACHNVDEGTITISNGVDTYTIMDKNLGATQVWTGDTNTNSPAPSNPSFGDYYQWGINTPGRNGSYVYGQAGWEGVNNQ
jgi:hypothetical protein